MSGFLPDLANWALRGGAGDEEQQTEETTTGGGEPPLSVQEMRAQRLARMEALQQRQQETSVAETSDEPEPMQVEAASPPKPAPPKPAPTVEKMQEDAAVVEAPKKKKRADLTPADANKKFQRKKELLVKKILSVTLQGGLVTGDDCVPLDLGDTTEISVQSITDILATRLSMKPSDDGNGMSTQASSALQKPLIAYLGQCHRRSSEELKILQQTKSGKAPAKNSDEIVEILKEIQRQVVSYSASSLMIPDIFEMAKDATIQLAKCLTTTVTDPATSITFGVHGASSSFYYMLCEELLQQDEAAFDGVIGETADYMFDQLEKLKSVMDGNADGNASVVVSSLTALCLHKRAADALSRSPRFLLPVAGSPEATQQVRPPGSSGANIFQQMMRGERPYLRRSGPGLEKDTFLGRALRVGVPRNNAAFSPTSVLRQSLDVINRTNRQQRQQLRVHQEACNQFIMALIKAGAPARSRVMQWFTDAMLVNVGASGLQPDQSKVSSTGMLLNVSVMLLKLCEPFVTDDKKVHLIDPGFVSSPADHGGVFSTEGDDAVARLGENTASVAEYNPKNRFIPQCFFFCARSLHFGIVPLLSHHENLLRHISHLHYEISNSNRDMYSDPNFSMLVSRQRSIEVSLYQEEMVTDTLRFCNLLAKVLSNLDDDALRTMPEDFVSDVCHIIMSVAKLKGKMLRGLMFRDVFHMVVKLLSARYASVSDDAD